jgi:hypothetical protein
MIFTFISSFGISDISYFLITFLIIYVAKFYYRYFTRPNPLPGPLPLPFFGNAHQSIGLGFNDWLLSMHKKYGDMYEVDLAGLRLIVLCRTDLVENMNVPSAKTNYPYRLEASEGFVEYGIDKSALILNNERESWKYNRQFFTQAMMTPSFNYQAIEWSNELWGKMESHWNKLGEDQELDLAKWMHRFTTDITFRIATGLKNDSLTSYYNTFILKNNDDDSLNEKEIEESEQLINSLTKFISGVNYFLIYNKLVRHYIPFIRGKAKNFLKNRDYLFDRMYKIIKERRIEIENTPLEQPLSQDMLTSCITANTSRDVNSVKHADANLLRPMTDEEILGKILDVMLGGTDTVNSFHFIILFFFSRKKKSCIHFQNSFLF